METRIALLGIIIEESESVARVNTLLHEYADNVISRMGVPYREKGISIISLVMDAPQSVISALSGKLGMISGISVKTMYAKQ